MSKGKQKGAKSILFTWMLIIAAIVVATSAIFTIILIKYRTEDIIKQADARLLMAAELNRELLGPHYHDRITDETSVSEAQFREIVARNDDLCRRLDLQYLWSVLVVDDNRLVFTSATHSDINDPASSCAAFFETHHDPEAFTPALGPDLNPSFSTFQNEWSEGRQVLIPRQDAQGRTYIFGASVQLTELNAVVRQTTLTSIGIGLGIILGAFLLSLVLVRSFTAPIVRLTEAAGRMATGDLDVPLASTGSRELQSLSHSLDQMRQGLKRHLEELRESEEKYRVLFESFPLGITVTDQAGNIVETNAIAEALVGVPQTEHEERAIDGAEWRLIRPDGTDIPPAEYAGVIALRENRRVENREMGIVKPDETITWLNVTAAPIPLKDYGVVISYGDITRQKQAEAQIHFQATLLDAVGQAVIATDLTGAVIYFNRAAEKLYAWPAAEAMSRNILEVTVPDISQTQAAEIMESLSQGNTWSGEFLVQRRDGTIFPALVSDSPVLDEAGQLTWIIGISTDITERKQVEDALRENEERYRKAQELGHVGNWEYNLQTTEFWGSDEARRIYGFAPDSGTFTTDEVENCIPERERVHQALIDLIERDTTYNLEFEIITNDTHQRKTIISIAELERDAAGKPLKVTGVILDITKRKQAEEEVKTALEEKEVLLQELYHRTKNNMNVINSMLSLQAMYTENQQVTAVFSEMQHRIHSMALVHQKLYQSKNLTSIDLNEYIRDLVTYLMQSYRILSHQISLSMNVESMTVLIDIAMPCGLILNELISNVFKHAFPEGRSGEISINARQNPAGEIILQVADNGVGVPAGVDLKHGNNLGLKSVVAIAEHQLHGEVWFETNKGVNCQIKFKNNLYHPRI